MPKPAEHYQLKAERHEIEATRCRDRGDLDGARRNFRQASSMTVRAAHAAYASGRTPWARHLEQSADVYMRLAELPNCGPSDDMAEMIADLELTDAAWKREHPQPPWADWNTPTIEMVMAAQRERLAWKRGYLQAILDLRQPRD